MYVSSSADPGELDTAKMSNLLTRAVSLREILELQVFYDFYSCQLFGVRTTDCLSVYYIVYFVSQCSGLQTKKKKIKKKKIKTALPDDINYKKYQLPHMKCTEALQIPYHAYDHA